MGEIQNNNACEASGRICGPGDRLAAGALFFLSGVGLAALMYTLAAELHGPSVMVGLVMAVCVGAFGVLIAPNRNQGPRRREAPTKLED